MLCLAAAAARASSQVAGCPSSALSQQKHWDGTTETCHVMQPSPEQQLRTDEEINRVVLEAMQLPELRAHHAPSNASHPAALSTQGSDMDMNEHAAFEEAFAAERSRPISELRSR